MRASRAFALGLVAFFAIPLSLGLSTLLGPFAWGLGREAVEQRPVGLERQRAEDAITLGKLTTALLGLLVLAVVIWAIVLLVAPPMPDGMSA